MTSAVMEAATEAFAKRWSGARLCILLCTAAVLALSTAGHQLILVLDG